jgi:hypothetical protein
MWYRMVATTLAERLSISIWRLKALVMSFSGVWNVLNGLDLFPKVPSLSQSFFLRALPTAYFLNLPSVWLSNVALSLLQDI